MYYQPTRRRRPATGPILTMAGVFVAFVSHRLNTVGHQRYQHCLETTLGLLGSCSKDNSVATAGAVGTVVGIALVLAGLIVWAVQWNRG
jgi:hypothetical protein